MAIRPAAEIAVDKFRSKLLFGLMGDGSSNLLINIFNLVLSGYVEIKVVSSKGLKVRRDIENKKGNFNPLTTGKVGGGGLYSIILQFKFAHL